MKQLHDELDEAVFDAYGWPPTLTAPQLLTRLVDLNTRRATEEEQGLIRYLRPEFQNPDGTTEAVQLEATLLGEDGTPGPNPTDRRPWPSALIEQIQAVRMVLTEQQIGLLPEDVAKHFHRARRERVSEILEVMVMHGQVREVDGGRFAGA